LASSAPPVGEIKKKRPVQPSLLRKKKRLFGGYRVSSRGGKEGLTISFPRRVLKKKEGILLKKKKPYPCGEKYISETLAA